VPGRWSHLAARFVAVVTSRPLGHLERAEVRRWLTTSHEADGFFAQADADQRHGYQSARAVMAEAPERSDLIRAALLHDLGKRHARLGPMGRVAASVAIRLGLPLNSRRKLYRDHGALSAAELAGAEAIVVDFARHHHGRRPTTIAAQDWDLLVRADSARVGR
jgi:hypothetical protein